MIRDMKYSDIERVLEIDLQGIESGKATFRQSVLDVEAWNSKFSPKCRIVWEEDGHVQGWVALIGSTKSPAYTGVYELSIYVDNKYKCKGIGNKLLQHLIEESHKENIWTLESQIFSDNLVSIELHKKNGFRVVGYREKIARDKFGEWKDVVLLERRNLEIM